ncbi:MAG: Ig-like domain-containing protein [Candidatus Eremiobacterota bacterium]
MNLQVEVPGQARVMGRSLVSLVTVEVVDPASVDQGTLSGKRLIARGDATTFEQQTSSSPSNTQTSSSSLVDVTILDVIPGNWQVFVFGKDAQGNLIAAAQPFNVLILPGQVFFQRVSMSLINQNTPISITVTPANAVIQVGATQQFQAVVTLANGTTTSSGVTWNSSDTAIATVDQTGLATGVGAGGPISITGTAGSLTATGLLTVNPLPVVLQSINLSYVAPSVNPLRAGQQFVQLLANGLFSDGTNQVLTQAVTYASSDTNVVTVSNAVGMEGRLMPIGGGTATITATDPATGIVSAAFTVTVANQRVVVVNSGLSPAVRSFTLDANGILTDVTAPILLGRIPQVFDYHSSGNFAWIECNAPDGLVQFNVDLLANLTVGPVVTNGFNNGFSFVSDTNFAYQGLGPFSPGLDQVQAYRIDQATGNLTASGAPGMGRSFPGGLALAPFTGTAQFLFMADNSVQLAGFALNAADGSPGAQVPGSPVNLVDIIRRIEVNTTNNFLVVTLNSAGNEVRVFSVNPATGALGGAPVSQVTLANAQDIEVSPNQQHVFVLSTGPFHAITTFTIDNATGALNQVSQVPLPANQPQDISLDTTGRFMLLCENGFPVAANGQFKVIRVDPATGALTAITDTRAIPGCIDSHARP